MIVILSTTARRVENFATDSLYVLTFPCLWCTYSTFIQCLLDNHRLEYCVQHQVGQDLQTAMCSEHLLVIYSNGMPIPYLHLLGLRLRRDHALNKSYALNNQVHLITSS